MQLAKAASILGFQNFFEAQRDELALQQKF